MRVLIALLLVAGCVQAQSLRHVMRRAGVIANATIDPLRHGLVAEYLFATDASDTSGNGCNGILMNGAIVTNGYLQLDGIDDWVQVNYTNLNWGTGSGSISVWCKFDQLRTQDIFTRGRTYAGGKRYKLSNNTLQFLLFNLDDDVSNLSELYNTGVIDTNSWWHIVSTYDSSAHNVRIYVNLTNTYSASISALGSLNDTSNFGTIGAANNESGSQGTASFFDGDIDALRIYTNALTTNVIEQLYNEGHD